MNRYIHNIKYKVPFKFCEECKSFSPYNFNMSCLYEVGCKEATKLYKSYTRRGKDVDGKENADE